MRMAARQAAPSPAPPARKPAVQPKLRIGPVDDPLEREADRIADEVVRMPQAAASPVQRDAAPGTVRRKAVFRPDSGCGDYPMCEIVAAWDLAAGLVDDTILIVDDVIAKGATSSHHAKLGARFPSATPDQLKSVKTTLTSIKAELASDILAKCVREGEPCTGNVLAATTCSAKADIDFCILFNMNDCRDQAAAIIHEIAHHIVCGLTIPIDVTTKRKREVEREGKTETIEEEVKEKTSNVYRHFPEFKTLTADQALQNPDSFAVLCLDVSNRSTCFECAHIMQTDAKKWEAMKKRLKSEHSAPAAGEVQRKCAACAEEDTSPPIQRIALDESPRAEDAVAMPEEEPQDAVQRKEAAAGYFTPRHSSDAFARRLEVRTGAGEPLGPRLRQDFAPWFGNAAERARIHRDAEAGELSRAISARAFTRGHDIYFGAGEYRPQSTEGRRVLAHELTHVLQQTGGGPTDIRRLSAPRRVTRSNVRQWGVAVGDDWEVETDNGTPIDAWIAYTPVKTDLSYWCHGHSLGTFARHSYSVYSGDPIMETVNQEWRAIAPASARGGDIAVWLPNYEHSCRIETPAVAGGGLDPSRTIVSSKNGGDPLVTTMLANIMTVYPDGTPTLYRRR